MRRIENRSEIPWSEPVVVADLREDGLQRTIEAGTAEREQIARFVGLRDLPRLSAHFVLTTVGEDVRVEGHVSAVVGQTCVVTLERVENTIDEAVSLLFAPPAALTIGLTMAVTNADTTAANAVPITTAIARSTTLPRMMNSLKPLSM